MLELAPREPRYLVLAARLMMRLKGAKAPSVRGDLERLMEVALDVDPESIEVLMTVGEMLRKQDREDEAAEVYERVTQLDPKNHEAIQFVRVAKMRKRRRFLSDRFSKAPPTPKGDTPSLLDRLRGGHKR